MVEIEVLRLGRATMPTGLEGWLPEGLARVMVYGWRGEMVAEYTLPGERRPVVDEMEGAEGRRGGRWQLLRVRQAAGMEIEGGGGRFGDGGFGGGDVV